MILDIAMKCRKLMMDIRHNTPMLNARLDPNLKAEENFKQIYGWDLSMGEKVLRHGIDRSYFKLVNNSTGNQKKTVLTLKNTGNIALDKNCIEYILTYVTISDILSLIAILVSIGVAIWK